MSDYLEYLIFRLEILDWVTACQKNLISYIRLEIAFQIVKGVNFLALLLAIH